MQRGELLYCLHDLGISGYLAPKVRNLGVEYVGAADDRYITYLFRDDTPVTM